MKTRRSGEQRMSSVTGGLAGHQKRAKSTIRKYGRSFGIGQQGVIASAQFRLTNDVEGSLQLHSLAARNACRLSSRSRSLKATRSSAGEALAGIRKISYRVGRSILSPDAAGDRSIRAGHRRA